MKVNENGKFEIIWGVDGIEEGRAIVANLKEAFIAASHRGLSPEEVDELKRTGFDADLTCSWRETNETGTSWLHIRPYYDGTACPSCGSSEITADNPQASDAVTVHRNVSCEHCETEWTETYKLSDYDVNVDPTVEKES